MMFFFFFQAEDGIRDYKVTGVQTCALPISLALDGLLDSLTPGQLEEHPLRARRLGVAPARVVEREVLDDHEVGHVDVREAGDERLDGGPGVLRRARRGADAEGGEKQQEDGGAGHVLWL